MMLASQQPVAVPWYRVSMVWLLIALPLTAVVAGFTTLWLAVRSDDGLVVDDYYRRGKEINVDIARDHAAAARGLNAELQVDTTRKGVWVTFARDVRLPAQLEIQFLHTTRQGYDRRMLLPRMADGSYSAPMPVLAPGRYHIQLSAENWRLIGSLHMPGGGRIALVPGVAR